ncbi:hypothetical protein TIFTF001_025807 [Ficus carica]|uniref:Uncharacterized protein n=1 Tax=Ficus carica TaxID=3494 RepID=A0AA88AJM3_FICCA|nr:hypothetical protein TIFTF001_025807 [Ficus carica]
MVVLAMVALSAAAQDSERALSPAPAPTVVSGAGLAATFRCLPCLLAALLPRGGAVGAEVGVEDVRSLMGGKFFWVCLERDCRRFRKNKENLRERV